MLRKNAGFAATSLFTLGLGLGAATAIFSIVNAVLLKPLPYKAPDRLVLVWGDLRNRNVTDFPFSNPDFADLRAQTTAFEGLAAVVTFRNALPAVNGGEPEQVRTANVTDNIVRVLGLSIEHGRDFEAADGAAPPAPPRADAPDADNAPMIPAPPRVVLLSHEFWMRHFGGDPGIVGRVVRFGNGDMQVVGILAAGSELLFPPGSSLERRPDVWNCMRVDFTQGQRNDAGLRVIGRLAPRVTIEDAQAQVDRLAVDLRARFPIKQTAGLHFRVERMSDDLVADVRPAILALMGSVMFVLLIACANVANLLLSRAASRERELAVRSALGASRGRLVRQLLVESLTVSAGGALIALLFAKLGIRLLLQLKPESLPRIETVAIDPQVLGFAAAMAVLSTAAFGLVPALRGARPDTIDVLRQAGRSAGLGSGTWLRSAVVTLEVALSFVLLIGSGLMLRSFVALHRVDPGYDPAGLLTFAVGGARGAGDRPLTMDERAAFKRDFRARLHAIPGVTDVTAATPFPLDGVVSNARWGPLEAAANPSLFQQANVHFVLPGYFEAMRTRVADGRTFTEADNRPDARVVVIDSALAARVFPNQRAAGRKMLIRVRTEEPEVFEVIGVVAHQRHEALSKPGREAMFFTDGLRGHLVVGRWAVRSAGDASALASAVRAAAAEFDPRLIVSDVHPMSEFVDQAGAETRFALVLIAIFAGIALVLAAVGLYGVLSTVVRQRTPEIGVRMAFGAGRARVFRQFVGQGLKLSGLGVAIGAVVAFAMTGALRTLLVGVRPTDPPTFAGIAVMFMVIAAAACGLPAFRAARLDPNSALRDE